LLLQVNLHLLVLLPPPPLLIEVNLDCLVPQYYAPDPALGSFVVLQRVAFRTGKLSKEQVSKLEALGFVLNTKDKDVRSTKFNNPNETSTYEKNGTPIKANTKIWNNHFNNLTEYYREFGDYNVTRKNNRALYFWLFVQRRFAKEVLLSDEQLQKFSDIRFELHLMPDTWQQRYNDLLAYQKEFGN
jgi:hypothetical protein